MTQKTEISFDLMWPDDSIWLPPVLEGKKLEEDFLSGENDEILDFALNEISNRECF